MRNNYRPHKETAVGALVAAVAPSAIEIMSGVAQPLIKDISKTLNKVAGKGIAKLLGKVFKKDEYSGVFYYAQITDAQFQEQLDKEMVGQLTFSKVTLIFPTLPDGFGGLSDGDDIVDPLPEANSFTWQEDFVDSEAQSHFETAYPYGAVGASGYLDQMGVRVIIPPANITHFYLQVDPQCTIISNKDQKGIYHFNSTGNAIAHNAQNEPPPAAESYAENELNTTANTDSHGNNHPVSLGTTDIHIYCGGEEVRIEMQVDQVFTVCEKDVLYQGEAWSIVNEPWYIEEAKKFGYAPTFVLSGSGAAQEGCIGYALYTFDPITCAKSANKCIEADGKEFEQPAYTAGNLPQTNSCVRTDTTDDQCYVGNDYSTAHGIDKTPPPTYWYPLRSCFFVYSPYNKISPDATGTDVHWSCQVPTEQEGANRLPSVKQITSDGTKVVAYLFRNGYNVIDGTYYLMSVSSTSGYGRLIVLTESDESNLYIGCKSMMFNTVFCEDGFLEFSNEDYSWPMCTSRAPTTTNMRAAYSYYEDNVQKYSVMESEDKPPLATNVDLARRNKYSACATSTDLNDDISVFLTNGGLAECDATALAGQEDLPVLDLNDPQQFDIQRCDQFQASQNQWITNPTDYRDPHIQTYKFCLASFFNQETDEITDYSATLFTDTGADRDLAYCDATIASNCDLLRLIKSNSPANEDGSSLTQCHTGTPRRQRNHEKI